MPGALHCSEVLLLRDAPDEREMMMPFDLNQLLLLDGVDGKSNQTMLGWDNAEPTFDLF